MTRIMPWLFLVAIVLGITGFAVASERANAQEAPSFDLDCVAGDVVDGQGTVTCTLSVTGLPQGLPDLTLTIDASYADVDGSGDPSPGDQLKCFTVTTPDGTVTANLGPCADQSDPPAPPVP